VKPCVLLPLLLLGGCGGAGFSAQEGLDADGGPEPLEDARGLDGAPDGTGGALGAGGALGSSTGGTPGAGGTSPGTGGGAPSAGGHPAAGGAGAGGREGAGGDAGTWSPVLPGDVPPLPTDPSGYCRNPYIGNGAEGTRKCGFLFPALQDPAYRYYAVYECVRSNWTEVDRCTDQVCDTPPPGDPVCLGECGPPNDQPHCEGTTMVSCSVGTVAGQPSTWLYVPNHPECTAP